MFRVVDEAGDPLPRIANTPDHVRVLARLKIAARPIRLKTLHDLAHLVSVGRNDGIIAGLRKIFRFPIKRHDPGRVLIDNHRFLVRYFEGWRAVDHFDAGLPESPPRIFILGLPIATRGVEHDANPYAASVSTDHGIDDATVREHEHFYAQRNFGLINCAENHRVRQPDIVTSHFSFKEFP
jgi:hypothetical protein